MRRDNVAAHHETDVKASEPSLWHPGNQFERVTIQELSMRATSLEFMRLVDPFAERQPRPRSLGSAFRCWANGIRARGCDCATNTKCSLVRLIIDNQWRRRGIRAARAHATLNWRRARRARSRIKMKTNVHVDVIWLLLILAAVPLPTLPVSQRLLASVTCAPP